MSTRQSIGRRIGILYDKLIIDDMLVIDDKFKANINANQPKIQVDWLWFVLACYCVLVIMRAWGRQFHVPRD